MQALRTEEYWKFNATHAMSEDGELHSFTAGDDGTAEAVLYEVMPMEIMPEAVRAMISQALKMKRVVKVIDDDHTAFTVDVKGTPVDFGADITVSDNGDNTTKFTYDAFINVNIPFMGAAVEPKVLEGLPDSFDKENQLLAQWIADNMA